MGLSLKSFWIYVVACTVLLGSTVQAQIFNLDTPSSPLHPGWNNQASFSSNHQAGNSVVSELGYGIRVDYLWDKSRVTLDLDYDYGTNAGQVFADNGDWALRYVAHLFKNIEYEGVLSSEYNLINNLNNRLIYGGGLRFGILPQITYGVGFVNERDRLLNGSVSYAFRMVNYISCLVPVNTFLKLNSTARSLMDISGNGDHRVSVDTSAAIAITENINFTTTIEMDYDSHPPINVKNIDTIITQGLVLTF